MPEQESAIKSWATFQKKKKVTKPARPIKFTTVDQFGPHEEKKSVKLLEGAAASFCRALRALHAGMALKPTEALRSVGSRLPSFWPSEDLLRCGAIKGKTEPVLRELFCGPPRQGLGLGLG